ncbi:MAG: spermidine/putrescine transport system permease [Acidimicrobiaceae bacterium]|nr:spermidine/putrescine transport system permease [Acidimicrobiaceae bacterium]
MSAAISLSGRSSPRDRRRPYALLALLPVGAVICLGFVVPLVLLVLQSFHQPEGFGLLPSSSFSLASYSQVLQSPIYRTLALNTLEIAGLGTLLTTVLTFPVAYFIRFRLRRAQNLALLLTLVLLFAGYIVKVYTWRIILGTNGVLNSLLQGSGLIHHPLGVLLFSKLAVFIVVTYLSLPVSILILVGAMQNADPALVESARDLGAGGVRAVVSVLVPIAMPGIVASLAYGFVAIAGDYVTPQLVGGPSGQMLGVSVYDEFVNVGNPPVGSAITLLMMIVFVLIYLGLRLVERRIGVR